MIAPFKVEIVCSNPALYRAKLPFRTTKAGNGMKPEINLKIAGRTYLRGILIPRKTASLIPSHLKQREAVLGPP
jgi:hypothetical protein